MTSSAIRCPGCGAADTSPAAPGGVHTCVYCGVRYRISAGAPQPIAATAARSSAAVPLILAILALGGLGLGLAVLMASDDDASGDARGPAGARVRSSASARPAIRQALPEPAHNPAVSVEAAEPEPERIAPATAEFTLESTRTASDNGLWVYGYLHNTSPFTLGKTKITAVFYDKAGAELGTDSGYTEDDVIAEGARAATVLLISDPPRTYDRVSFEVHAKRPTYLPAEVSGLELEADPPRRDKFFGWKYAGKVHNKSGQPAKFVKVRVLGFDADDKFAGHAFSYAAAADALADGATARFDGTLLGSDADFKRFEFQVSGKPAG